MEAVVHSIRHRDRVVIKRFSSLGQHSPTAVLSFLFASGLQTSLRPAQNKKSNAFALDFLRRDDWIRTSDHTHPMRVFYQAELHPGPGPSDQKMSSVHFPRGARRRAGKLNPDFYFKPMNERPTCSAVAATRRRRLVRRPFSLSFEINSQKKLSSLFFRLANIKQSSYFLYRLSGKMRPPYKLQRSTL